MSDIPDTAPDRDLRLENFAAELLESGLARVNASFGATTATELMNKHTEITTQFVDKLRVRADLDILPQRYEGRTYYVVKDPVSLRYYRFKEQEHFLIGLMDGSYTLDDAQKASPYEGKKVKVTGTMDVSSNTIHVETIQEVA